MTLNIPERRPNGFHLNIIIKNRNNNKHESCIFLSQSDALPAVWCGVVGSTERGPEKCWIAGSVTLHVWVVTLDTKRATPELVNCWVKQWSVNYLQLLFRLIIGWKHYDDSIVLWCVVVWWLLWGAAGQTDGTWREKRREEGNLQWEERPEYWDLIYSRTPTRLDWPGLIVLLGISWEYFGIYLNITAAELYINT